MTQQLLEPTKTDPPQFNWSIPIRGVALTLGLVVLVLGAGSVVGYFMIRTDTDTRFFTGTIHRLQVRTTDGNVVIRPGSSTQVGATVVSRKHSAYRTAGHSESVNGDLLTVDASCRGGFFIADQCSVDLEITVAAGTEVTATTSTGNISVTATRGPVTARSSTGDLRVSRATGPVTLNTNVGDITGELLDSARVLGRSNTGDVRLSFATAPEQVQGYTDIGDVRILVPDDAKTYRVSTEVDLGDRHIDVPTDPASSRTVDLSTSTGDVRIGLLSQ